MDGESGDGERWEARGGGGGEVRARGRWDEDRDAHRGRIVGLALLLVMGLFGFVVFSPVCTAGYNVI